METKISDNRVQVVEPKMDSLTAIRQIISDGQEDSFYVCDVSDIIEKYRNWKTSMPRVKTFYAVKCNDSRVVLETLVALGTGFDCATKEEIEKVLSLGVSPESIIFANPTKKPSHIRYAAKVGVSLMTFDNESELYKVKKEFPTANLVLRIRYDDPSALYVLGSKFGADPKLEAENLLVLARSLNLNVMGICFHIGSGSKDYTIFSKAIATAKKVFEMGSRLGFNFTLLDIGGGFPGEKNSRIIDIGQCINKALNQHFPDNSIKIIAEPGRYYVDSAFTLATCINSAKTIVNSDKHDDQSEIKMYYVDTSMFGALLPVIFGDLYIPQPVHDHLKGPVYTSIVWGASCGCYDKICDKIELPLMKVGEWIVFEKAGAYSLTLSCEFNGVPTPNVHSIISTEDWLFLTEKVTRPLSRRRFTKGMSANHFRTGLDLPSTLNKYTM